MLGVVSNVDKLEYYDDGVGSENETFSECVVMTLASFPLFICLCL